MTTMRATLCFLSILLLSACATTERHGPLTPEKDPAEWQGTSAAVLGGAGNKSPYTVFGEQYEVLPDSLGYIEIGVASWYGRKFHGRLTSNGEIYDMYRLTAAHRNLPIPTIVQVTNLDNGRKALVRINDRGPFHDDRLIDLSYQAAVTLGFADKGTAPVVVEAIDERNYPELDLSTLEHKSFYLQIGAFSRLEGAKRQMDRVLGLVDANAINVDVQILQSELEQAILHKVWLGPMPSEEKMEQLARLVENANLGVPLRVTVE